jgi:hypothetical protein
MHAVRILQVHEVKERELCILQQGVFSPPFRVFVPKPVTDIRPLDPYIDCYSVFMGFPDKLLKIVVGILFIIYAPYPGMDSFDPPFLPVGNKFFSRDSPFVSRIKIGIGSMALKKRSAVQERYYQVRKIGKPGISLT